MSSPALLPLLSRVDGLDGVQHQILQLQSFHQVCVPHNACTRGEHAYFTSRISVLYPLWAKRGGRNCKHTHKGCITSVKGLDVVQGLINGIHLVTSLLQNGAGTEHCSMGLHSL